MGTIVYNKVVRDRIPDIIRAAGKTCRVSVLSEEAFIDGLRDKLTEEVEEYRQSKSVEELADIVEVVQGILHLSGLTWEAFEALRAKKREERGGFEDHLYLVEVTEP